MKNANTNIPMNIGNSWSLVIKNTLKLVGGLALAGMIAMSATLGTVSADSPSKSSNYMIYGPYGMDADFLNTLGKVSSLGPDLINDFAAAPKVSSPNSYLNDDLVTPFSMAANVSSPRAYIIHGPDVVEPNSASAYVIHGPDVVEPSNTDAYIIDGPDVVEPNSASAYIIDGPDVAEPNSASAYVIHGPVVFEPSIANPYLIDRPDTSEWAG